MDSPTHRDGFSTVRIPAQRLGHTQRSPSTLHSGGCILHPQQGTDTPGLRAGRCTQGTTRPFLLPANSTGVCSVANSLRASLSPNPIQVPCVSWCKGHNTLRGHPRPTMFVGAVGLWEEEIPGVTAPQPGHHPGSVLTQEVSQGPGSTA